MRSLVISRWASQQCWGVTAGKARHNSSNVRGVTAGKVRHNSIVMEVLERRMIPRLQVNGMQFGYNIRPGKVYCGCLKMFSLFKMFSVIISVSSF